MFCRAYDNTCTLVVRKEVATRFLGNESTYLDRESRGIWMFEDHPQSGKRERFLKSVELIQQCCKSLGWSREGGRNFVQLECHTR